MRQFIEVLLKDCAGKMKLVCMLEKSLSNTQMSFGVKTEGVSFLSCV